MVRGSYLFTTTIQSAGPPHNARCGGDPLDSGGPLPTASRQLRPPALAEQGEPKFQRSVEFPKPELGDLLLAMFFEPNSNVWRVAKASRAALLVEGASYFAAVRHAMIHAERSILVAGWDIHSRTRLVGPSGQADDGYPEQLAEFLSTLATRRPQLDICILLWDFSMLYVTERDPFPTMTLQWSTPSRVRFCLDDCVPLGSSQHQKLIVIDDNLAFSGGLDVTIRRWDTASHRLHDSRRVDPSGKFYPPFHDVQMMVDGDAARSLGDIVRMRWTCAACEDLRSVNCNSDPWPDNVRPDFTDVEVGIARTEPGYANRNPVHEVERLFFDCIDAAEHTIYIENQFLTAPHIAERLAQRLREKSDLEILIVVPATHKSWLEAQIMCAGRVRFAAELNDVSKERVSIVFPQVTDGKRSAATMVHAKVMIIDDKIIRVGSANLNNRSMGTDTECDLAIVGKTPDQRRRIAELRNGLIGNHCGVSAGQVAEALQAADGSLIAVARNLRRGGHSLEPVNDLNAPPVEFVHLVESIADPEQPIGAEDFMSGMLGGFISTRQIGTVFKVVGVGLIVVALAVIWQFVPLAKPDAVRAAFTSFAGSRLAPFAVIAAFVVGGAVAFPVTVLIAATAAAFGPWIGFSYAAVGALVSALATYGAGAAIGKKALRSILGARLNRLRQRLTRRGVIAVAAMRLVPVAPFTFVNIVAGASGVPLFDYLAGTLLGMLPGLIMISAVGHEIARVMTAPTAAELAILAGAVAIWIVLSIAVQVLVSRYLSVRR